MSDTDPAVEAAAEAVYTEFSAKADRAAWQEASEADHHWWTDAVARVAVDAARPIIAAQMNDAWKWANEPTDRERDELAAKVAKIRHLCALAHQHTSSRWTPILTVADIERILDGAE